MSRSKLLLNGLSKSDFVADERRAALTKLKMAYPGYFDDMSLESITLDTITQKQREYNKTLEDQKALMEAQRYLDLKKQQDVLEKTSEGNIFIVNKLKKVNADILKIEEESEKKEKALLQSRYESGQAYENMAKYAKDINKFLIS